MGIRVLGIAPYSGLRDLFYELAKEEDRFELDVEIADLGEAIDTIGQSKVLEYDVIVSRGGTATLLREYVEIPVIDVPVSGYDILRVLTLIKDSNSRVAVIGFPNICHGAATVSNLLNLKIPIYPIEHESEVRSTLVKAFNDGVQVILGDVVTVRTADEMGYHGVLITSGRESVQEAFAEVIRIYDIYKREQEKANFYEEILQRDHRGILVIDASNVLRFANSQASSYMNRDIREWHRKPLQTIFPEIGSKIQEMHIFKRTHWQGTITLSECLYDVEIDGIGQNQQWPYTIVYLDRSRVSQNSDQSYIYSPTRLSSFAQIIGSSPEILQVIEQAKQMAKTANAIWISGEPGTGKTILAQSIHNANESGQNFYKAACRSSDSKRLEEELFGSIHGGGFFQQIFHGTLYLEDIEYLPVHLQEKLLIQLRNGVGLRVIVSSSIPWGQLLQRTEFNQELAYRLGEHYLYLPPLRERLEDLEEICRILIARHNSKFGKQMVGVRDDVIHLLKSHDWPGNIKELKNAFEDMLLLTNGHYVERKEAEIVWKRYKQMSGKPIREIDANKAALDMSGTLDEIETQVILHVLQQEGMNQSKAAARLGINRSTLWRKLKYSDAKAND
ncbi:PrpR N-terminal domain-containing protein [Fodinisporobacter ferrooxydans]|uniref:PrpR N-terminal domain-containing protein n=1 Tax=Fodinisporobacter ferrooxydans TaxID=2901836 RepID=A0ABY4CXI5_9BACL|nr:PrpR N-terminal domain-containing protein [Alicyclobacillaceae bacterium MYW30-H2]